MSIHWLHGDKNHEECGVAAFNKRGLSHKTGPQKLSHGLVSIEIWRCEMWNIYANIHGVLAIKTGYIILLFWELKTTSTKSQSSLMSCYSTETTIIWSNWAHSAQWKGSKDLKFINDPAHPRRNSWLRWLGLGFDILFFFRHGSRRSRPFTAATTSIRASIEEFRLCPSSRFIRTAVDGKGIHRHLVSALSWGAQWLEQGDIWATRNRGARVSRTRIRCPGVRLWEEWALEFGNLRLENILQLSWNLRWLNRPSYPLKANEDWQPHLGGEIHVDIHMVKCIYVHNGCI